MILHLIQHGEAQTKEQHPDRPLSAQGEADIKKLAKIMRGKIHVSRIMHSGKTRALQTARIIHDTIEPQQLLEAVDGIDPNDPVGLFIDELLHNDEECVIVGHMPFLSKMASTLVCGDEGQQLINFTPGTLASIARTESGSWQINCVLHPDLLAD